MNHHTSDEQQIDDAAVQRYFNGAGDSTATTLSMMAHEHNLPASAARYRLSREILTIRDWLDSVSGSGQVLDVGCGAGAWTEIFANRYKAVIGIDRRLIGSIKALFSESYRNTALLFSALISITYTNRPHTGSENPTVSSVF